MRNLTFLWILVLSVVTLGTYAQTENNSEKIDITQGSRAFLTMGGDEIEGSLKAEIHDNTNIQIYRYVNGAWQKQVFGTASKASLVYINGTSYTCPGSYFTVGTPLVLVSHAAISENHIQSVWETEGIVQLTQDVTYVTGTAYLSYKWTITNLSGTAMSDIRFFNGQDNYLNESDGGMSAWNATTNSIIAYKTVNEIQYRMFLQGITPPFAYDGGRYTMMRTNVWVGALSNTADPLDVDQGYALEWRTASIAASGSYEIRAIEKFSTASVTNLQVTAPLSGVVNAGSSNELTFQLTNLTASATDVTLNSQVSQEGWTATIQGSSTITLAANATQNIVVEVTAPSTAEGTTASVTLNAVDASGTASDFCNITVPEPVGCNNLEGFSELFTINISGPIMDKLDAPNTITPNGDGINDFWVIPNAAALADYDLTIFNNLGATLYESKGYANNWDCKYKGNDLPSGTYYYVFTKGSSILKGFITVIREKK